MTDAEYRTISISTVQTFDSTRQVPIAQRNHIARLRYHMDFVKKQKKGDALQETKNKKKHFYT